MFSIVYGAHLSKHDIHRMYTCVYEHVHTCVCTVDTCVCTVHTCVCTVHVHVCVWMLSVCVHTWVCTVYTYVCVLCINFPVWECGVCAARVTTYRLSLCSFPPYNTPTQCNSPAIPKQSTTCAQTVPHDITWISSYYWLLTQIHPHASGSMSGKPLQKFQCLPIIVFIPL